MKSLPISSRVSIRTVLLVMLFLIGGWGLIASLQQVGESWRSYRENRSFAEGGRVAAQLLTVGRHLADERGRTVALLRGAAPASEKDLAVIEERRRLGDASLDAALESGKGLPQDIYAGLLSQRQEVRRLRQRVDRAAVLSLALRDPQLADHWFGTVSGFIDRLQGSVERLAGENRPGDKITRLTLLSAAMLQLRITAGGEASRIAQAVAAGKPLALETLFAIHESRGREDQLWHDIERLAVAANVEIVYEKVEEVRKQYLAVFRVQQDGVLVKLAARQRIPPASEALSEASQPVLDGMSDLMVLAAEEAMRLGEAEEEEAHARFVAHVAWLVALLHLLVLSLRYVLRQVVAPLEVVDRDLRRMGAFSDDNDKGGEIHHLRASAAALERSIAALAEAQRIAHIGSWELDHQANVLAWSDECYRIFEIDPQRFGGTYEAFLDAVHPDDRERVDSVFRTSLEKRESYEIEHRLYFPDGRVKYVHEHCETRFSPDGKALHSIGTVQDITVRKEMENALRESRRLLAEAQRIARVGSWEYDIATDTHIWSDELFRIFEIDPVTEGASYEGCINATHPDDREAVARAYLNSVETGRPYESEHRLLMVDGRIKHVHERGETVRGPDGKLLYAVGMMQDITDRKQAEQRLKEALEFTEGVINAIPDILFEVDRNGRYLNVWTHTPELLAVQKEMLLGKTVHEVLSPEGAHISMESIREADEKGFAQGRDIGIDLPQGRRWFSHTLSKKPGGVPGEATFLALSRDVTERRQLEEALASREQEFRSLAESSPDFIVRYDREGRHRYLNDNWVREFGLGGMEDVLGKRPGEVWADGRFSPIEEAAAQAVESGETKPAELAMPDGGGSLRYWEISVVPERDVNGSVIGTIAFGRDITAYRESERKLKEALEFNEGVVNAIPDILFEVDRNGRYLNVWTHRPELLAAQKEVLLGKTVRDVLAPESVAVVMDSLREAEKNGLSFGKVIHIDLPHGTSWFEFSVSKKAGSSPSDGTFLVLSRDVTDRRRMERELRSSERMFRALAENAPDNIVRYDQACRILYINPNLEALFGTPMAEVIGKRPSEVFPDGRYDGVEATVREVVASGKAADYFLSVPDGELGVRLHHLVIVPERNDLGHVKGVLALGRDVTALKRLEAAREEALAEAQRLAKLRSEFIAHMSHELRTPLNGILGYAQMLERDRELDSKQREGMEMIRQSGEHLLALIEDILDLARIESGKLELDIADIPLAKFLQFVAGIAGVRAKQKHLEFSCELAPGLPEGIRGDEKRLRQILLNLLSNSVKYTDRGKITLSVAHPAPARLAFAVTDTGSGIAPADRETIFRPFEQAGDARQRSGGTGLGLAISRQLVRLMGGDIEVESREGEGSTFRFELELPEIEIEPGRWRPPSAEMPSAQQDGAEGPAESLIAPPRETMREFHRLALLGNMRDIGDYAERIGTLDPRYRPFAEHLIRLAGGFQSKAILAFIEGYLT